MMSIPTTTNWTAASASSSKSRGAGDIQYEDGAGDTNTETGLAAGDSIQVAGIPVLVRKILAASTTVSGVAIGRG